eukprot:g1815.t1
MSYVCREASFVATKGRASNVLLLDRVSLASEPGEVTGILGPSGAGKTLLLNMLTLNLGGSSSNKCFAKEITVNGQKIHTLSDWMQACVYVPSILDLQFPTLTCKQVLTFAAKWQSREKVQSRVDDVLSLLGLESCADTQVAGLPGSTVKGLSGGQKRRLAIGVGLLRDNAQVLFIDDVTSGLDSAAAFAIMKCLVEIARKKQISVICTLNQPAEDLWGMCDRVLLLTEGKTAFFGYRSRCLEYFREKCGLKNETGQNAADFVLQHVNADFVDRPQVDRLVALWETEKTSEAAVTNLERSASKEKSPAPATGANTPSVGEVLVGAAENGGTGLAPPSTFQKFQTVFARDLRVTLTDPVLYGARAVMNLVMSFFLVLLWYEGTEYDNEFAMNRMWPFAMCMSNVTLEAIVCVYFFNHAHKTYKLEIRSGFYPAACVVLSHFVLAIPGLALCTATAIFPGNMYGLGNYEIQASYETFTALFLISAVFEGFAKLCSLSDNMLLGFLGFIQFWFASFLFCGFMIEFDLVIWPLRALTYTSPHRHAIPAILYADFARHEVWDNAQLCPAGMDSATASSLNCIFHASPAFGADGRALADGFRCPSTEYQCWGYTGVQVLETMHKVYPVVDSDNVVWMRCGIMLGFTLLWNLLYGVGLVWKMVMDVPKLVLLPEGAEKDETLKALSGARVVGGENKGKAAGDVDAAAGASKRLSYHPEFDTDNLDLLPNSPVVEDNVDKVGTNGNSNSTIKAAAAPAMFAASGINVVTKEVKPSFLNKQGKPCKQLIEEVSLSAKRGEVYAILGPSGAGKTTLLDAITCNSAANLVTHGEVQVNGRACETLADLIGNRCVYIAQHNEYFPTLTPRQTLEYTAEFTAGGAAGKMRPGSKNNSLDELKQKVDVVIEKLGLQGCQNQKVGGKFSTSTGLSAGQKKRLSVAQALIKEPLILFLDEPTTGLDAASAYHTMRYIRKIAREENVIVVCTIHQPSYSVWSMFDSVQLLSLGKTAYAGPRGGVEPWFASIGHAIPSGQNPAEFLLDKINSDFSPKEVLEQIVEKWKTKGTTTTKNAEIKADAAVNNTPPSSTTGDLNPREQSGDAQASSSSSSYKNIEGEHSAAPCFGATSETSKVSPTEQLYAAQMNMQPTTLMYTTPGTTTRFVEGEHEDPEATETEEASPATGSKKSPSFSTAATKMLLFTPATTGGSLKAVTRRAFHVALTDYTVYLGRVPLYWVSCLFFCLVYIDVRTLEQPNVLFRIWLVMWLCKRSPSLSLDRNVERAERVLRSENVADRFRRPKTPLCVFGCLSVIFYGNEYKLVREEIRNGYYPAWQYHVALVIVSVPMVFLLALAVITGNAYGVGDFDWSNYFPQLLNLYVNHLVFEAFAQASSVQFDNVIIGMLNYVGYWFNGFLFMGMMLDLENCFDVFKWMSYAFPFKYSYGMAVYLEYEGRDLTPFGDGAVDAGAGKHGSRGVELCPATANLSTGPMTVAAYKQANAGNAQGNCNYKGHAMDWSTGMSVATGYTCGAYASYSHVCYGASGKEALDTINRLGYSAVTDEDFLLENFLGMLVLLVLNKLTHVVFFNGKVHKASKLLKAV